MSKPQKCVQRGGPHSDGRAMSTNFLQKCVWWLCAGIGFDLSQRLLDHVIDMATDRYALLEWLK